MKAWDVVGYTADVDVWCPDCLPFDAEGEDSEGNPVHPIFAVDEGAEVETCNVCRAKLME